MQNEEVKGIIASINTPKEKVLSGENKLTPKELKFTIQKKTRGDMA